MYERREDGFVWKDYEGQGVESFLPSLRGSFNWIEDQTTDEDWYKWGERLELDQHFIDRFRQNNHWNKERESWHKDSITKMTERTTTKDQ